MFESRLGEFAALGTALCWTFGAMSFEMASKRSGSLSVNLIRLVIGFCLLSLFCLIYRGLIFPSDASSHIWIWLALSGFIGFVFGDFFLFRAFVLIGSRISMLIMSAVPPITALIGWLILGEKLTGKGFIGMALTISGIALVVLERKTEENGKGFSHPVKGVLMAFGGALGQSIGLVLSKFGMGQYDPFAATQIRILAGTIGFTVLFIFLKRWPTLFQAVRDRATMKFASIGAVLGPFLGVSFSLLAVQYTTTGVASTIMAIVPVLIIPPAIILFKEKVTLREIIGALSAVAGVSILFL
jgi:drug/metabolite transporter (DMT)-like permease